MSQIHQCKDNSEVNSLYPSKGLYLKPIARINVSVHYPELKQSLTTGGKSVSSWDIMERIKALVAPEIFISLRVVKNTLEFIRFEGDLENRTVLKNIVSRLDGKTMKVTGFKEPLKIRTGEAKLPFPSKYDWDSFFRDAKNMNEMKAGERPDTIHFQNLPCKWFSDDPKAEKPIPSEKLFRRIWDVFGDVRCVDIPICDPYRSQMTNSIGGIKTFTFSNDNVFEAYVQFRDYMSFVKAMDALRGCFLLYQEGPVSACKFYVANIKVDFDRSKHLGDESIRRRKAERVKLMEKDQQKKTAAKLSKMEAEVQEKKKLDKDKKESDKTLAKIEYKIAMEERKYLIARRKLEAIRLMDYLFETVKSRVKAKHEKQKQLKEKAKEENKKFERVMEKYKETHAAEVDEKEERLRKLQSCVKVPIKSLDDHNERDQRNRRHSDDCHPEDRERSGGAYSSRFIGDWEVKAKSHRGSEVKVSSSYVPVEMVDRNPHFPPSQPPYPYPPGPFRGRGRGDFFRGRGRGRGGPPFPHHHPYQRPPFPPYPNRRYEDGAPGPMHHNPHYRHREGREDEGPPRSYDRRQFDDERPPGPPRDYERNHFDDERTQGVPRDFHPRREDNDGRDNRDFHPRREDNDDRDSRDYHRRADDNEGHGRDYPRRHEDDEGQGSHDSHHRKNKREDSASPNRDKRGEPVVLHNFGYLNELDRAYEKYFQSITKRHNEPSDRSPKEA